MLALGAGLFLGEAFLLALGLLWNLELGVFLPLESFEIVAIIFPLEDGDAPICFILLAGRVPTCLSVPTCLVFRRQVLFTGMVKFSKSTNV